MTLPISDEIEMITKPCIVEHTPGVPAYWNCLSLVDYMVLIYNEMVRLKLDRAAVYHRLTVVLASGF